jgi:hypothetical protein
LRLASSEDFFREFYDRRIADGGIAMSFNPFAISNMVLKALSPA